VGGDAEKEADTRGGRLTNQSHPGFTGGSTCLTTITGDTGANYILPNMLTTPVSGDDMV